MRRNWGLEPSSLFFSPLLSGALDELAERGYIARDRDRSVRGGPARIRVTKRGRTGRAGARGR